MRDEQSPITSLFGQLVDSLPAWERFEGYYLSSLLPSIGRMTGELSGSVASTVNFRETDEDKRLREARFVSAATQLRERLASDEWRSLGRLVREYRSGHAPTVAAQGQATQEVLDILSSDFLHARSLWRSHRDEAWVSEAEFSRLRTDFVQEWTRQELGLPVDLEQAAAVAAVEGDVQIVARAGAGKTRTLVTRAIFLQKHCKVAPQEILLLAFNRSAAEEMRERLREHLGADIPHVMTFHALAHALVHPVEDMLFDEPAVGSQGLSRAIQRVIDDHLRSDRFRPLIRDLMLMHFRDDWERIVEGGFQLPVDELIQYRKALPRETLRGEYVKSFGEKLIANTLFENDVDYKYERNFRWGGVNYKPDFYVRLNDAELVLEYFGLEGEADYDQMSREKREFWRTRPKCIFLEFAPHDILSGGVEAFKNTLLAELHEAGVVTRALAKEEIWERIRRRAVDRFTEAVQSFVSRCRKSNLTPDALDRKLAGHTSISEAETLFLPVVASVYRGYLDELIRARQEDFDGLVWRAVDRLNSGEGRFIRDRGRERGDVQNLRFVHVDEFQDFSKMFNAMTSGIRFLNPSAQFFCVGDDWQAINGFAGSDLSFFTNFDSYFRNTTTLNVRTNYRSPRAVVEVGNALMTGRGVAALVHRPDSGWLRRALLTEFEPSPVEQARHEGDEATPALLRLVRHLFDSGRDVVMLARTNRVPWYVSYGADAPSNVGALERFAEHIRSFFPEEDHHRLKVSTTHKYKGLESPAVIILDANSYPLVHPNWIFLRPLGDTVARIEDEERRLFYVALTRAQHSLVIMSDSGRRDSPFLNDIEARVATTRIAWSQLSPPPSLDTPRLEVRVRAPYALREQLKSRNFRWNPSGGYWWRILPPGVLDFDKLLSEAWVMNQFAIDVVAEDGRTLAHKAATTGSPTR